MNELFDVERLRDQWKQTPEKELLRDQATPREETKPQALLEIFLLLREKVLNESGSHQAMLHPLLMQIQQKVQEQELEAQKPEDLLLLLDQFEDLLDAVQLWGVKQ